MTTVEALNLHLTANYEDQAARLALIDALLEEGSELAAGFRYLAAAGKRPSLPLPPTNGNRGWSGYQVEYRNGYNKSNLPLDLVHQCWNLGFEIASEMWNEKVNPSGTTTSKLSPEDDIPVCMWVGKFLDPNLHRIDQIVAMGFASLPIERQQELLAEGGL